MKERKIKFVVPFPLSGEGLRNREEQLPKELIKPGFKVKFVPVRNSVYWLDSYYEGLLLDFFLFEEGIKAEEEGYDALCIDTVSDSGIQALRSRLKIPVVGPGVASMHFACMLGDKFSILTMWKKWNFVYIRELDEYKLWDRFASIRDVGESPDQVRLLKGKKPNIFNRLEQEGLKAVEEDGANVIILGSTTMHQAHKYLSERLPVPVLNPGLVAYKIAEMMVELRISQSKARYPSPQEPKDELVHAMVDGSLRIPWKPK